MEKRQRSPNFTEEEKLCLCCIISDFSAVIEDKKTDRTTFTKKIQTWKLIERNFNARCPSSFYRDWSVLKRFYENRKKEVRKIKAAEMQELFKTGGGPASKVESSGSKCSNEIILSIMNSKGVYGLGSTTDSNNEGIPVISIDERNGLSEHEETEYEIINDLNEMSDIITDEENNNCNKENSEQTINAILNDITRTTSQLLEEREVNEEDGLDFSWKKHCPNDLRSKIPNELQPKKAKPIRNNRNSRRRPEIKTLTTSHLANQYEDILNRRRTLLDIQIQLAEMEMDFKKKEYSLKLEKLELEMNQLKKNN